MALGKMALEKFDQEKCAITLINPFRDSHHPHPHYHEFPRFLHGCISKFPFPALKRRTIKILFSQFGQSTNSTPFQMINFFSIFSFLDIHWARNSWDTFNDALKSLAVSFIDQISITLKNDDNQFKKSLTVAANKK